MLLNNTKPVDQTQAINKVPHKPNLIGGLGIFRDSNVGSDAVTFDVRDNSFHVLEDKLRNVADKNTTNERPFDQHTLAIPHFPIEKTIGREKLNGARAFDTEFEKTVANAVAEELVAQAESHDLHEEFVKASMAVKGELVTNNYGTFNMLEEFGVQRPTQTLAAGNVIKGLREAQKKAKAGLHNGGMVRGYTLLATEDLFEAIVDSADAVKAYELGMQTLQLQIGEIAGGYQVIQIGNTTVILYDDTFTKHDGTTEQVLSEGGVLLPRTTLGRCYFGPESTFTGLARGGQKRFASSYRDPKDRWIEVSSEQNTLPILEQFGATVQIAMGA